MWVKTVSICALAVAALILASCSRQSYLLYAEPSDRLDAAASALQEAITRAEGNGCRVRQVALGSGHGVGLGLGMGVGVGINLPDDCPDCAGRDLNSVVEKNATESKSESMFALVAVAECREGTAIDSSGNLHQ